MITPRQTRILRVPDLAAFRTTLTDWILALPPEAAFDSCVLVPTGAAGDQLRRTVEDRAFEAGQQVVTWPRLATRAAFYEELAIRLETPAALLSSIDREVRLSASAGAVMATGLTPPFELRPGLVPEIVGLYDEIRRLGRTIDDFARNVGDDLARDELTDRGAAQLLRQTRFLTAVFQGYEASLGGRVCDEHTLRDRLRRERPSRPLRHLLVTVADYVVDANGLWPADFDLMARLPDLEHVDIACTEAVLGAGLLERLHRLLPDLREHVPVTAASVRPCLVVPEREGGRGSTPALIHEYRDREEELTALARRLKYEHQQGAASLLHRTAVVVQRPLPYLYLARAVFADAGIPFEARDTLPLAAEPYAAAVDVVLEAVASDFSRAALLALVRSPHFRIRAPAAAGDAPEERHPEGLPEGSIAACDAAMAESRYLGGLKRLAQLVEEWGRISEPSTRELRRRQQAWPAAAGLIAAVRPLEGLAQSRRATDQVDALVTWLRRFDRPSADARRARVRTAVLGALVALGDAYRRYDPHWEGDITWLTATLRRLLGSRTFALETGTAGLQVVDAQAARYGEFDDIQLVGLIDGEWPERARRNVLYPGALLASLAPQPAAPEPSAAERDRVRGARAFFKDLVCAARERVRLSAFLLEYDAVVEPSMLVEDVAGFGLSTEVKAERAVRVLRSEALALVPPRLEGVPSAVALWAAARATPDPRAASCFRGDAGPWRMHRVSVSRIERYLDCPFRFYASEVLRLEEEPEDEDTRTPLERGRFLHELWEQFFRAWQARGHGRIEPQRLADARRLFEQLCEEALARLPVTEAGIERDRLLGTALSPGIAHRVFAMEAQRTESIVERLLEFPLRGDFVLEAGDGTQRSVTLNAKVDRIDLLEGERLRVIDYKSKRTPDLKQALQLPLYSLLARNSLRDRDGQRWEIAEALYVSFEGARPVVPMYVRGRSTEDLIVAAQDRFLTALDDIAAGLFPPRPAKRSLCGPCPYRTVCRLDIVEAPEASGD
ncbi:MAG: PD-(D/E)XK nuclease family protein [Acidobacteriota bacterium]